jgi:hypothetical protein
MEQTRRLSVLASLSFFLLLTCSITRAITIEYEVLDLPDSNPGEDRWEYTYHVSDHTFTQGDGFTIFFDHNLYTEIEEPLSVSGDWDVTVWQPDPVIPDAGAYDALAVTANANSASLSEPFIVRFAWTGTGSPGPQPFDVYDANWNALVSGETIPTPINPWDVNNDDAVNILDLVAVAREFGTSPPEVSTADVNRDGTINIVDLVLVGRHFGENYSPTAAPSISQAMAMIDGVSMVAQGRRHGSVSVKVWLDDTHWEEAYASLRSQQVQNVTIHPSLIRVKVHPQIELLLARRGTTPSLPSMTTLLSNYPNPFNPDTWIPYVLARDAMVQIQIHDARGHLVRTLPLGHQRAGFYADSGRAAYWDGRNDSGEQLPSGIYYYTLQAGDFTATSKMALLK